MKAFALFAALAFLNTCTAAKAVEGPVETRQLGSGTYASSEREGVLTAFDEETYRQLWEANVRGGERPAVDFKSESVVFVFAGMRNTGGWRVVVSGASLEGDTLVLEGAVQGPPKGAIVTQAITYPYSVVAVKSRAFKDVTWLQ